MVNVAILTSGGDNCASSGLIKAIRDNIVTDGIERVIGVRYGFEGLLSPSPKVEDITNKLIDADTPSSILGYSRTPPVYKDIDHYTNSRDHILEGEIDFEAENQKRAEIITKNLKDVLECEILIILGGDGTIRATKQLKEISDTIDKKINTIPVPSTMDNDFNTRTHHGNIDTALNSGYPTAADRIINETIALDYLVTQGKRVMFIETFGRGGGWLAIPTARGGGHITLCPEFTQDSAGGYRKNDIKELLYQRIAKFLNIFECAKIGISEGTPYFFNKEEADREKMEEGYNTITTHSSGSRRLGGAAHAYLTATEKEFKKGGKIIYPSYHNIAYKSKMPTIVSNDGKIQMTGPIPYEKVLSNNIGLVVKSLIKDKKFDELPVLDHVVPKNELEPGIFKTIRLTDIDIQPFRVPEKYLDEKKLYITQQFIDFVDLIRS